MLKYSVGSFKETASIYIANMKLLSGEITIDEDRGESTFSIFSVTEIDVFCSVIMISLVKLTVIAIIRASESNPPVIVLY